MRRILTPGETGLLWRWRKPARPYTDCHVGNGAQPDQAVAMSMRNNTHYVFSLIVSTVKRSIGCGDPGRHPLDHRAVDAGQLGLRDPGVVGHVSSRVSLGCDMETPATIGCDTRAGICASRG
jgi:hypothetical protein